MHHSSCLHRHVIDVTVQMLTNSQRLLQGHLPGGKIPSRTHAARPVGVRPASTRMWSLGSRLAILPAVMTIAVQLPRVDGK